MPALGPRLVVAGTHSGVGKTTVATGLMAALAQRGLKVASAKVGPDYIDPGYHTLATGRPGRNLDAWMCGTDAIGPLAGRVSEGAEVLVVEGVMGLFDGAADPEGPTASTAQVAGILDAPVVLVVDAAAMSGSVAALVYGFATFDPAINVAGVVVNRVGSDSHEAMVRDALTALDVPVLGVLRRSDKLVWRDRHLGLVPVAEQPSVTRSSIEALAAVVERSCDVGGLLELARGAPRRAVGGPPRAWHQGRARVALAGGPAFSFYYPENLESLEQAGAELVPFDPLIDASLPTGVDALYAGGGFPEEYVKGLAANRPLLADVRRRVSGGLLTWAECGGLLWLAQSLDGYKLSGVITTHARMTEHLTLGYRRATIRSDSPFGPGGTEVRGHEFHYSVVDPPGNAIEWRGRQGSGVQGFATPTLLASYIHTHLGAAPAHAEHLVKAAAAARRGSPPPV